MLSEVREKYTCLATLQCAIDGLETYMPDSHLLKEMYIVREELAPQYRKLLQDDKELVEDLPKLKNVKPWRGGP